MGPDRIGFVREWDRRLVWAAAGAAGAGYLVLSMIDVRIAVVLVILSCSALLMLRDVRLSLNLYVLFLPFASVLLLNGLPLGLSAMRLLFLLFAVVVMLFILYRRLHRTDGSVWVFFGLLALLSVIAWTRSTGYALQVFAPYQAGSIPLSRYVIDYVSWNITAMLPMAVIALYYRKPEELDSIVRLTAAVTILLAASMGFVYLFKAGIRSSYEDLRSAFGTFLGMHANDIANFFFLSFPILLVRAIHNRKISAWLPLLAVVAGTVLTFSRTAYFLVLIGFFLCLLLTGRMKWLPVAAVIMALALNFLLPEVIVDRAMTGVLSGNSDELSAGRIDYIWKPLINELESDPGLLLLGAGRFGITSTDAWRQSRITMVTHAHNMYLDGVLDTGILGLTVFLALFMWMLLRFWKTFLRYRKMHRYQAELLSACIVSILCWLLSGLTGRSFFPSQANGMLWIILGLGIALSQTMKRSDRAAETGGMP